MLGAAMSQLSQSASVISALVLTTSLVSVEPVPVPQVVLNNVTGLDEQGSPAPNPAPVEDKSSHMAQGPDTKYKLVQGKSRFSDSKCEVCKFTRKVGISSNVTIHRISRIPTHSGEYRKAFMIG